MEVKKHEKEFEFKRMVDRRGNSSNKDDRTNSNCDNRCFKRNGGRQLDDGVVHIMFGGNFVIADIRRGIA